MAAKLEGRQALCKHASLKHISAQICQVLHFWPTLTHKHRDRERVQEARAKQYKKGQKWANSECKATEKAKKKTQNQRKQGGKTEKTEERESLAAFGPIAKPVSPSRAEGEGIGARCGLDGGTYVIAPALTAAPFVYPCVWAQSQHKRPEEKAKSFGPARGEKVFYFYVHHL